MEISQALQNAQSLKQVVELVNEGGASFFDQNEIAAQYSWDAAQDADYGMSIENLEGHLNLLAEAGAKFDHSEAIQILNNAKK